MKDCDDQEAAEVERCELSFDVDTLRDRMRALLSTTERLSVVADLTPAEAASVAHDVEHAADLVDDALRLLLPRMVDALRLDVRPW